MIDTFHLKEVPIMPRPAKVWWWKARKTWCAKINGKRVNLGPDFDAAQDEFYKLKGRPKQVAKSGTVAKLVDDFLDYTQSHKAESTYVWYRKKLQDFLDHLSPKTLRVSQLKKHHVTAWLDAHPGWGDSMQRGALTALARLFNWAVTEGHIELNPLKGIKKPPSGVSDRVISDSGYKAILKHAKGPFRLLCEAAMETGARPQELTKVEVRHVDLRRGCWAFPAKESKGKKHPRTIWLSDRALAITKQLMAEVKAGVLFRNRDGNPWTAFHVANRFGRLKDKLGVKYRLYDFRFTYATNGVKRGIDLITLQHLMGHRDLSMLSKIYAKVAQDGEHMRQAARRAVQ